MSWRSFIAGIVVGFNIAVPVVAWLKGQAGRDHVNAEGGGA